MISSIMHRKDGAIVLILSSQKVLLFHRDNLPTIPFPDCWCLIGGGIEDGETPEQALVREVKEETGYQLTNFVFTKTYQGSFGEKVYFYLAFVDQSEESKFILGSGEGQEIAWFTPDEALKIKLTPNIRSYFETNLDQIKQLLISRRPSIY